MFDLTSTSTLSDATTDSIQNQCEVCPSCSTSIILASVITAILTALLATVIFVLVLIAVSRRRPKFKPEVEISARNDEGQIFEQMDGDVRGVASAAALPSTHGGGASTRGEGPEYEQMYMEVGDGENTFELQENEAYATHLQH